MERFGISVGGQLLEAVRFAGTGILLGMWYDLFRLFRLLARPPARRMFWQDLLFFTSAAAVTLLLSLPISSGRVRLFHLLALAVGFTCYYQTLGRLFYMLARTLVWLGERAGERLRQVVRRSHRRFLNRWQAAKNRFREKHPKKIRGFPTKEAKKLKKRLKLTHKV